MGNKIKELRLRFGLKQIDLANSLGVSPQAVSKWEKDENFPDILLIRKIASLFDISLDSFLGHHEENRDEFEATVFCAAHLMVITFLFRCGLFPGSSSRNPDPRTTDDKFLMEIIESDPKKITEIKNILKKSGAEEIKVKNSESELIEELSENTVTKKKKLKLKSSKKTKKRKNE